jgi:sugar phosphate isomerase/epimerase
MRSTIDRRRLLKTAGALSAGIFLGGVGAPPSAAAEAGMGSPNAKKLGWRLGCAAYCFRRYTLFEAIDLNASLGLEWIEGFTWQKLSKDKSEMVTNETMSPADRRDLCKKLADSGVKMASCYFQTLQEEAAARKTMEWAKDLGVETLVGEPPYDVYDMLEKLCDEYEINLAVHNHPEAPTSKYWEPETILKLCKGCSKRIGVCADTGHWARSKIKPVDALKKLEGRLISFHIKDITKFGDRKAECAPLGAGEGDVKQVIHEVKRQGLKPIFAIEHEHDTPNLMAELAECVAYFDKVAAELVAGQ